MTNSFKYSPFGVPVQFTGYRMEKKVFFSRISANRHTNTNETFREEGIDKKIVSKVRQA